MKNIIDMADYYRMIAVHGHYIQLFSPFICSLRTYASA